jgi:hypothetical protein
LFLPLKLWWKKDLSGGSLILILNFGDSLILILSQTATFSFMAATKLRRGKLWRGTKHPLNSEAGLKIFTQK